MCAKPVNDWRAKPRLRHERLPSHRLTLALVANGYVMLDQIVGDQHVTVIAVRHQLEDDYH